MSGLILKLGPRERILINGVVVENGDRRSRLNILSKDAKILRLRDAIHPLEANTPVRRACYVLQLILSGDVEESESCNKVVESISQLVKILDDARSKSLLIDSIGLIEQRKIYSALKNMRELIPVENELLDVSSKLQKSTERSDYI